MARAPLPSRVCGVGASAGGFLRGLAKQPGAVLRVHSNDSSFSLSAFASRAWLENPAHPLAILFMIALRGDIIPPFYQRVSKRVSNLVQRVGLVKEQRDSAPHA